MLKEFEPIDYYLQYLGQKYIAPQKALDDEEFMLQFKKDGGLARHQFKKIVSLFDEQQSVLIMQRVSNWMNQAQFGTPMFYCFFRGAQDTMADPGMAIRLYLENNRLGLTWEVSVLERTLAKDSLAKQHRLLNEPVDSQSYYLAFQEGVSHVYEGTEENRYYLKEKVATGEIRKVLIKNFIGFFDEFESMVDLVNQINLKFEALLPYYLATK